MADWNHYKKAYSGEWDAGNRREALIADILERLGLSPQMEGLGAGSTEFISGRAEEHGKEKADPDIFVPNEDMYIEVTGTNIGWVRPEKDIRVRPDKFENALSNSTAEHWVVHVLDGPALLRCIKLTEETCETFVGEGTSINTRHDDNETYVEIDPNHECIEPVTSLMERVAPSRIEEFEDVLKTVLAKWTTVDDITDGNRHSMGLKLSKEDTWDRHDSIHSKLHLTDHTGDDVVLTIFNDDDNEFTDRDWVEDTWYFFTDVKGGFYKGDAQLTLSDDASVRELEPEHIPE